MTYKCDLTRRRPFQNLPITLHRLRIFHPLSTHHSLYHVSQNSNFNFFWNVVNHFIGSAHTVVYRKTDTTSPPEALGSKFKIKPRSILKITSALPRCHEAPCVVQKAIIYSDILEDLGWVDRKAPELNSKHFVSFGASFANLFCKQICLQLQRSAKSLSASQECTRQIKSLC